jgi:hypothetical protein
MRVHFQSHLLSLFSHYDNFFSSGVCICSNGNSDPAFPRQHALISTVKKSYMTNLKILEDKQMTLPLKLQDIIAH